MVTNAKFTTMALQQCMAIAKNTPQGAAYVAIQVERALKKANIASEGKELIDSIQGFAKAVATQFEKVVNEWEGGQVQESLHKNLNDVLAVRATEYLKKLKLNPEEQEKVNIQLNYAISDDGKFVRGYEIEEEKIANLEAQQQAPIMQE